MERNKDAVWQWTHDFTEERLHSLAEVKAQRTQRAKEVREQLHTQRLNRHMFMATRHEALVSPLLSASR